MPEGSIGSNLRARDRRTRVSLAVVSHILRLVEFIVIGGVGIGLFLMLETRVSPTLFTTYINTAIIGALFGCIVLDRMRAYAPETWFSPQLALRRLLIGWSVTGATLLAVAFAFKVQVAGFSRIWGVSWFVCTFFALAIIRLFAIRKVASLRALGLFDTRTVIFGAGPLGRRFKAHITKHDTPALCLVGFADDRVGRVPSAIDAVPVIGNQPQLERMIRDGLVDEVIIALPWQAETRIQQIVARLSQTPVTIRLAPDLAGFQFPNKKFVHLGGLPMLQVCERPISGIQYLVKLIEDKALAVIIGIILLPTLLLIAAAIKLDSRGPVLFRQERIGFNNRVIRVWKFRTMYHNRTEYHQVNQARRNDPRVTRVGRFLRRTSLDELPQLLNVFAGEMSIVGPRPHAPSTKAAGRSFDQIVDYYAARHKVKPGITGWAQVNGWRGETDTEEKLVKRVEHDIFYIDNWSVPLDLYIIARTFWTVLSAKNAY
jgi:Undecaprenyl-phosphate glucose phosphotransferase